MRTNTHSNHVDATLGGHGETRRGETADWHLLIKSGHALFNLAGAELKAAAFELPDLWMLWRLKVPVLILFWVSFSSFSGWLAYELSGYPLAGFLLVFLLQAALAFFIGCAIDRKLKAVSLPVSRDYAVRLAELVLADARSADSTTDCSEQQRADTDG